MTHLTDKSKYQEIRSYTKRQYEEDDFEISFIKVCLSTFFPEIILDSTENIDNEKWVHFFGPVSGKTKVDSFIGYAAHLGLIRGGTPSGLYC